MESEPSPKAFPPPLFIAGCMRSGTSMLVDKLTQHPQLLKIGVELNDIWTAIGDAPCLAPDAYRDESHAHYEAAANMVAYMADFIKESRRFRRHLMRAKNYLREGKGSVFLDWDHLIPVNKSPHLSNKLRYVHALFPASKILFIIRGIEGHSASMKAHFEANYRSHGWVSYFPQDPQAAYSRVSGDVPPPGVFPERRYPGDFSIIPEMWIRLNALALEALQSIPRTAYRVIRYEELVENQPAVLTHILDFLHLHPKHEARTRKIIRSGMQVINTTTKGNPLEKWKQQLSEAEKASIHAMKEAHQEAYDFIQDQLLAHRLS